MGRILLRRLRDLATSVGLHVLGQRFRTSVMIHSHPLEASTACDRERAVESSPALNPNLDPALNLNLTRTPYPGKARFIYNGVAK